MADHLTLADVAIMAATRHRDQLDKAGRPYVGHLMRVWAEVWRAGGNDDAQMAALLHDIVEDGHATAESSARPGCRTGW